MPSSVAMTLLDEAKQIKIEVLQLRPGAGRRFGSKLRGQILDWIVRAEESARVHNPSFIERQAIEEFLDQVLMVHEGGDS